MKPERTCGVIGCARPAAPQKAAAGLKVCGLCYRASTSRTRLLWRRHQAKAAQALEAGAVAEAHRHRGKAHQMACRIVTEALEAKAGLR